jgi:hypothetical protein
MLDTPHPRKPRSVLWSFKFVGTALAGSLAMSLVSTFAPPPAQLAVLGSFISILAGLFVSYVEQEGHREGQRARLLERLQVPLALAPEPELFDHYSDVTNALGALAGKADPVLRQYALLKLTSISEEVRSLAEGKVVFSGTESWRTVYEQLLLSPGLRSYRSVSWVKTEDYWQDQPGRQSMRLNYFAAGRGVEIERVVILRGELWPAGEVLPAEAIWPWVEEQRAHGIRLFLVREAEVGCEDDVLSDFGIYGTRATGTQELDEQSRTQRFTLRFDPLSIRLAQDRWARLLLFARPYEDLIEQPALPPEAR